jgi:hypothetical protein
MADDQRYCLSCGERRGDPRVPLTGRRPAPEPALPAAGVPPAAEAPRSGTPLWIATVGVLLLAMGVGVMIGRSGADPAPARPSAPITVTVPGTAGAAPAPAVATPTPAAPAGGKKAGKSSGGAAKTSKQQLQQLDNLTPEQYRKKSKSLPKTVGTEGKAPPKDNKPAGGGTGFQEIG